MKPFGSSMTFAIVSSTATTKNQLLVKGKHGDWTSRRAIQAMYYCMLLQGGLRRGGLTPALAPQMPVITEDVVYANRGRKCDSTAKGYINIKN